MAKKGKLTITEIIIMVVFTIGYWIGLIYLNSYVINHNTSVETIQGETIYLKDGIFPLGLFLWGIISLIMNAQFSKS